MTQEELKLLIRHVPDYPKPGILFYDITTLLKDGAGFRHAVEAVARPFRNSGLDVVVGIEARGFIFGAAVADRLGTGFVPVRKPGKLPSDTVSASYELEYGIDALEMHHDAVESGQRVLVVDDLLATGGRRMPRWDCSESPARKSLVWPCSLSWSSLVAAPNLTANTYTRFCSTSGRLVCHPVHHAVRAKPKTPTE